MEIGTMENTKEVNGDSDLKTERIINKYLLMGLWVTRFILFALIVKLPTYYYSFDQWLVIVMVVTPAMTIDMTAVLYCLKRKNQRTSQKVV